MYCTVWEIVFICKYVSMVWRSTLLLLKNPLVSSSCLVYTQRVCNSVSIECNALLWRGATTATDTNVDHLPHCKMRYACKVQAALRRGDITHSHRSPASYNHSHHHRRAARLQVMSRDSMTSLRSGSCARESVDP